MKIDFFKMFSNEIRNHFDFFALAFFYRSITSCDYGYHIPYKAEKIRSVEDFINSLNVLIQLNPSLIDVIDSVEYGVDASDITDEQVQKIFAYEIEDIDQYSDFFEQVIDYHIEKNLIGLFSTPKEVVEIINRLLAISHTHASTIRIYNPCSGVGKLALGIKSLHPENLSIYGEELNSKLVKYARMLAIIQRREDLKYSVKNVITESLIQDSEYQYSFDVVLSHPTSRTNLSDEEKLYTKKRWEDLPERTIGRTCDPAYILNGLDALKDGGTLYYFLPKSISKILERSGFTKFLLDNGLIEGMIQLPLRIVNEGSYESVLLILSKKENDQVFFVDARHSFVKDQNINRITVESIDQIVEVWKSKKQIDNYSLGVGYEIIRSQELVLDFKHYWMIHELEHTSKKLAPVTAFLRPLPRIEADPNGFKLIKIKDLSTSPFNYKINRDDLEICTENEIGFQKISDKALLIASAGENLRCAVVYASEENPVFFHRNILAFEILSDQIDEEYLMLQLFSPFLVEQLDAFATGRQGIAKLFHYKDFVKLQIEIISPYVEEQQLVYQASKLQHDKDQIKQANLQSTIDLLIQQHTNEIQWQLHDLRNTELLAIKNKSHLLMNALQQLPEIGHQIIDERRGLTLSSVIHNLFQNASDLTRKLSEIYQNAESIGVKEPINIISFLLDFEKKQHYIDREIVNIEFVGLEKFENSECKIECSVGDLTRVMNNIFENILRHGFESAPKKDISTIRIEFSSIGDQELTVQISNNGNYIPISPEDYFANGGFQGRTGNTGKGGYMIKQLMERNGNTVSVDVFETDDPIDFTFRINLNFPLLIVEEDEEI